MKSRKTPPTERLVAVVHHRLVRNLRFRAVMVKWTDSHYRPGWDNGQVVADELVCNSLGWLVSKTKHVIVIASHITDENDSQRCGQMTIPRKSILSMNYL